MASPSGSMGFTGGKALGRGSFWYIEAFNAMEAEVRRIANRPSDRPERPQRGYVACSLRTPKRRWFSKSGCRSFYPRKARWSASRRQTVEVASRIPRRCSRCPKDLFSYLEQNG